MAVALGKGGKARVEGLVGRADLNGLTVVLLGFFEDVGRWGVCTPTGEQVRVKVANLVALEAPPEGKPENEEEDDSGVYVNATLNGRSVAIDPKKLKVEFERIVKHYKLDTGEKADAIADFLCNGEAQSVSTEEFATRFGTSVEDASSFLAWINVGVAFKEQYMDPHEGKYPKKKRAASSDLVGARGSGWDWGRASH
eukprot:CAMPEP_0206155604 /NCGR_PEP_ID=MMETSP1474-20131121/2231_1 /ASSEMBLY_ACC=CAM_ASM_001110 /TAXON_ID=97495 /ORGANISM="Imantonia sp., Strain RCC918" /LENGTH=196 /DNA_ID=CAMNT_0053554311 /DNA_START=71 /DNA_END=662 /DNA_ORIENTATION=-